MGSGPRILRVDDVGVQTPSKFHRLGRKEVVQHGTAIHRCDLTLIRTWGRDVDAIQVASLFVFVFPTAPKWAPSTFSEGVWFFCFCLRGFDRRVFECYAFVGGEKAPKTVDRGDRVFLERRSG